MAREKQGFREQLERLEEQFPGSEIITQNQLMQITGSSKSTIWRKWKDIYNPLVRGYSKVDVARKLVML